LLKAAPGKGDMHSYSAYGVVFNSQIPLPELIEADGENIAPASVRAQIQLGPIDRTRPAGVDVACPFWATPRAVFVEYPQACAFLIEEGARITVDAKPGIDPRIVRLYLLGPALAVLLHQRGFLVLHASAVNVDGGVIAFVGDKGAGKSTMAAAMHARGHELVADDIVAIDTAGPTPLAYPGFPQLKLFPESAAQLVQDAAALPKLHPEFEKRAAKIGSRFAADPLPLRAVYELVEGPREMIQTPPPQQAFMQLVRHSYLLALLSATGAAEAHFRQAVSVASRVPVRRLVRRRAMEDLPAVARIVEQDVTRI
jgi:hypothetical protein